MQARKIRYVIGLTESSSVSKVAFSGRRHRPLNATFETEEELFLGTCDSREVAGAGVLVNTNLVMNIEQLTTRIGRLRLRRCGSTLALPIEDAVVENNDEGYDRLVQHLRVSAKEAKGARAIKKRLSYETLELIR
ncbi:hypothetical protein ANCCAN_04266 [Ancylostoma caninum]|uniref:Uncharacterized protein n=1 Tax=Ancylostoma caninum TaxID=29170 RepID=A0A368GZ62_ANCCA|nr:hypothetical protein ANCCAN_04266 [Ancylostoma caninum]